MAPLELAAGGGGTLRSAVGLVADTGEARESERRFLAGALSMRRPLPELLPVSLQMRMKRKWKKHQVNNCSMQLLRTSDFGSLTQSGSQHVRTDMLSAALCLERRLLHSELSGIAGVFRCRGRRRGRLYHLQARHRGLPRSHCTMRLMPTQHNAGLQRLYKKAGCRGLVMHCPTSRYEMCECDVGDCLVVRKGRWVVKLDRSR